MTDLREAAQMALDALEHGLPTIEDFGDKEQLQIQHKAISALYEALRAALAQPEQEPVRLQCVTCGTVYADGVPPQIAQPVPEPFGWYNAEHDEIITNSWYLEQRKNNPSDDSVFNIPLYTTPPQTKLEPVGYYYRGRFSTEKNAPGIGIYGVPVYTAPPQP